VSITASGAVAMKHAERYLSTVEDEVLAALTAEERATLHQLLARALEGDQAAAGKRVGRS
jgi:DNA-binding MarR family transcriptional regulator